MGLNRFEQGFWLSLSVVHVLKTFVKGTEEEKMDLLLRSMRAMQEQMKAMQKGQEEMGMRLARLSHKDSYAFKKEERQQKSNEEVKERLEVVASYMYLEGTARPHLQCRSR